MPIGKSLGSFSLSAFSFTISVACEAWPAAARTAWLRWKRTWCADRLHALDRREEDAHRQLVLGVEQPREGEDDVLGGHRLAVVEDGVVDEVEEPGLVVLLLPGLRQPRHELAGLVDVDELVVDVLVDLQRGVELGVARVHVHRLVDRGHAQGAALLGGPWAKAARTPGAAETPASGGDAGQPPAPASPSAPRSSGSRRSRSSSLLPKTPS